MSAVAVRCIQETPGGAAGAAGVADAVSWYCTTAEMSLCESSFGWLVGR